MNMKITVLDTKTMGDDLDFSSVLALGEVEMFELTPQKDVAQRIENSDVVILNKVKLNRDNLSSAKKLKPMS